MNEPSQPVYPSGVPQKKKLSPMAWVGIGCGAIVLIGVLVMGGLVAAGGWFVKKQVDKFEDNPTMAAAELIVRANPDLEMVSSDPEKGTMTIKNTQTGETLTVNAEDIQDGKITFTDGKGETVSLDASQEGVTMTNEKGETATFGATAGAPKNLPSWVPTYPGGNVQGSYDATSSTEGRSAMFSVTTPDSVDDVMTFYENKLKEAGFTVEKTNVATNDQSSGGIVTGKSADEKDQVTVMVGTSDQGTSATVTVQDKP